MPQGGKEGVTHATKVLEGPSRKSEVRHGLSSTAKTDTPRKTREEQATEPMDWERVFMKSVNLPAPLSDLIFF